MSSETQLILGVLLVALVVLTACLTKIAFNFLKLFTALSSVKCRAPGLSDHASPIRQTEARACGEHLNAHRKKPASARVLGKRFTSPAPEPPAARVG